MSNVFSKVSAQLENPRNLHGMRGKILLDLRDVVELLQHYQAMDSYCRAIADEGSTRLQDQLRDTVEALYHNGTPPDEIILMIARTMEPIINNRLKMQVTMAYMR